MLSRLRSPAAKQLQRGPRSAARARRGHVKSGALRRHSRRRRGRRRGGGGAGAALSRAPLRRLWGKARCACAAAAPGRSITWLSQHGSALLDLPRIVVAKAPRSGSRGGRTPAERLRRARVRERRESDAHGTGL